MRRLRLQPATYRKVAFTAVVLLAGIIVTGAAVRLTGSGLGCPEWPSCERTQFHPDSGDLHAMIEFVNRMVTGLVSVVVIGCVLGSLWREPRRRDLIGWSLGLVAGVFAQAVLGGFVVIFHLQPPFVMGHFILSLVLLWNALVLYKRAGAPPGPARLVVDPRVRTVSRALLVAVSVVVVTGTVVTATGPHGGDEDARRFGFEISSVARIHGVSVTVFVALTLLTLWMVQRLHADDGVRNRIGGVLFIALAQAAIGYIQYLNDIPALLVGMHVAGATALWAAVVWFHLGLFVRDPEPTADATGAPDRPDRERLQPA